MCDYCGKSHEEVFLMEKEKMDKHGWIMHFVEHDPHTPNNFNIHTHGLQEHFNHPDLQICLPMKPLICASLLHDIVAKIKDGHSFSPNTEYFGILFGDYKLKFIEALENGRKILRLVIPDDQGSYRDHAFSLQLTMTDNYIDVRQN